jgi:hypothetical protein
VIICLIPEQVGLGFGDKAVVEGWRRLRSILVDMGLL